MSNFKRYFQNKNLVFITIVTYKRQPILIKNIDQIRQSFTQTQYNFHIIAGVVLENHMHIIIQSEKAEDFSKIIQSFKSKFSRQMQFNENQTEEQKNRREKGIWQRKYYDHIIRNENDFYKHLDYIHYNPIKHDYVKKAKDWKYSSFKKFVKMGYYDENWCNFEDKNDIKKLDFE